jgi:hypothetical protein
VPVAGAEPAGYSYLHTYAETVSLIDTTVANHPDIAQKFSIGPSYHGRPIVGIKLTANVAAGVQAKPEALIDGLIHARERASLELAVYMISLLTDNYGHTGSKLGRRITSLLDSTVVYIIPILNPDGAVYDFKDGYFHEWRKNRQPIPNSSAIGVDLNRQFGFKWACCGGSSSDPYSDFYHGPYAWFAPEVIAFRAFVLAHAFTEELSLHSAAHRVLWPYGYTTRAVPSTMTPDDHATFVALGKGVASRNGYTAEQSSAMYVSDGDGNDWAYHAAGVFVLTLEMARGSVKRYYPSQSELAADLDRNRPAVLWYLEQAGCPYASAGLGPTYCSTATSLAARVN